MATNQLIIRYSLGSTLMGCFGVSLVVFAGLFNSFTFGRNGLRALYALAMVTLAMSSYLLKRKIQNPPPASPESLQPRLDNTSAWSIAIFLSILCLCFVPYDLLVGGSAIVGRLTITHYVVADKSIGRHCFHLGLRATGVPYPRRAVCASHDFYRDTGIHDVLTTKSLDSSIGSFLVGYVKGPVYPSP